jgi:MSHA biogenesis protein MshK
MAASLNLLFTILVLCISQIAAAESLPDPTRPAIDLGSAGKSGAEQVVAKEHPSHGLQSIIISPQRRAAIIDGKMVSLGGKYGNSRLVEVHENSVVLQNAHGRRVMEMFPKVNVTKDETMPQENSQQDNTSGLLNMPEQGAGGVK